MKIKMLKDFIGVEQKLKSSKKKVDGLFHIPESVDSLGTIQFVGESYDGQLKPGMHVYYGDKRTQIRMGGMDIQVMDPSNIIAIAEDQEDEHDKVES